MQVEVSDVVDRSPVGSLQITTVGLCVLAALADGFDIQTMAYAAPQIIEQWEIRAAALGPVFAAANLGVLSGSLGFSILADKIGRRPVLVAAMVVSAVITLATPLASSTDALLLLRFAAGVGIGCIVPNTTSLAGEYMPRRLRVPAMMSIGIGYTVGASLGGALAAWLIEDFGWQAVFYFGGAISFAIAVAMFLWLPESLQFMALRGANSQEIVGLLGRIDRDMTRPGTAYDIVSHERPAAVPVLELFRAGRGISTLLIWVVTFTNLFTITAIANWLPVLAREAGHPTATAVLFGATWYTGGGFGMVVFAMLIPRYGFIRVLVPAFLIGFVSIAMFGQLGWSAAPLFVAVFIGGTCLVAVQPALHALKGTFYPTSMRATGIAWGSVGRIGAIVGPMAWAEMVRRDWPPADIFLAGAVPALISAAAVMALHRTIKLSGQDSGVLERPVGPVPRSDRIAQA